QQTSAVTTAMNAILKQFQATPPPASVKAVEEKKLACGGAHPYYQCLAADGNTFLEFRDNIRRYVSAAVINYNQGNFGYRPSGVANQIRPLGFTQPNVQNNQNRFSQPQGYNRENNFNQDSSYQALIQQNQVVPLTEIARDVFVPVRKFIFPADFVIVDYESDPRVPLILGRPFLRTVCALIDVHGEEMILHDGDERLTLNMRHDTSSYSNQPKKESINMINIYDDSYEDYLEDLFATNHLSGNPTFSSHTDLTSPEVKDDIFDLEGDIVLIEKLLNLDSTKDLSHPHNINPLSGSTTSSSLDHLLEEFADELALITFPPGNDDLSFDIESDLREIEYMLNHDPTKKMDSIFEDLVDESNLANPNDNLVYTIPEMFTDEHTLDYSSPPLYDEYADDLVEFESDNDYVYNDPLDSKEEKINESKLFIDELDLPRSSDFLPSLEQIFNPGILIHENLSKVTTRVAPEKNVKKMFISQASLILEDFNPLLSVYELPFHKEVPGSETLLSFSSENEEKVFKPKILTSKGVHTSLLPKLSHRDPKAFKVIKIFKSPMKIFPFSYGEDIRIFDVSCLHFYPP
nr:hypothetical protein [Tanacetum cinerariifolium]